LTAPRRTAKHPNTTRMSSLLAARVRLHSPLDQLDHRDALIEGECTHTLMKLGEHLEIELEALWRGLLGSVGDQSPIGHGKGLGLACPTAGHGRCRWAFGEAL